MKTVTHTLFVALVLVATSFATLAAAEDPAGRQVVNINTASAAELGHLPGIGATKAQAIIKYRTKHPFKKVEQIMRVKGIGRKSFKKMQPYLTLQGQTTAKKPIKA